MTGLARKTVILLLCGGALVLGGATLSIFGHSNTAKATASTAIVIGIIVVRLAGPKSRWLGTAHSGVRQRTKWNWIDWSEAAAYVAAALAFIATMIAAANNIFDDRLTYTLLATVGVATAFYFCRRVFRPL
ncbi:MAG TPA: hypothetical protein VMU22_04120 [Rhizomicrobium sp.]|nr:hypothetical protein [Rhizomicrobium sp.]